MTEVTPPLNLNSSNPNNSPQGQNINKITLTFESANGNNRFTKDFEPPISFHRIQTAVAQETNIIQSDLSLIFKGGSLRDHMNELKSGSKIIFKDGMKLRIKPSDSESHEFPVSISSSDTVKDLKEKIQKQNGIPIEKQRLNYKGRELKDQETISSCKIENSRPIDLELLMKIQFSEGSEPPFSFFLSKNNSIKQIKELLSIKGIDTEKVKLRKNSGGAYFEDSQTLADLKVQEDDLLRVTLGDVPVSSENEDKLKISENKLENEDRTRIKVNGHRDIVEIERLELESDEKEGSQIQVSVHHQGEKLKLQNVKFRDSPDYFKDIVQAISNYLYISVNQVILKTPTDRMIDMSFKPSKYFKPFQNFVLLVRISWKPEENQSIGILNRPVLHSLCDSEEEKSHSFEKEMAERGIFLKGKKPISPVEDEEKLLLLAYEKLNMNDPYYLENFIEGQDRRNPVSEKKAKQYPYSALVTVISNFEGKEIKGTGIMIGPSHVLTASHNILSFKDNKLHSEITIECRVSSSLVSVLKVVVPSTSTRKYKIENDFAILSLSQEIGLQTGWCTVACLSPNELENQNIKISGFDFKNEKCLKEMEGNIQTLAHHTFQYRIDTAQGQSGCPIWLKRSLSGVPEVVGIHVKGSENKQYNEGVRITKSHFQWIIHALKVLGNNITE